MHVNIRSTFQQFAVIGLISVCLVVSTALELFARGGVAARSVEPVVHRVTASRDQWNYRGQKSGEGELGAIQVYASPDDIIEFRQSDGRHGVIFYRSRLSKNSRTELGRLVVVDHDFKTISDAELTPLKSFHRVNLATAIKTEPGEIVRIQLSSSFDTPLYFACPNHFDSPTPNMFGAILPVGLKPSEEKKVKSATFNSFSKPGIEEKRELKMIDPMPGVVLELTDGAKQMKARGLGANSDARDVTNELFGTEGLRDVAPNNDLVQWYFAESYQLDQDQSADIVALIKRSGVCRWYVLRNREASTIGSFDTRRGFAPPIELENSELSEEEAQHAICGVVDINNDLVRDIVVYQGDGQVVLRTWMGLPGLQRNSITKSVTRIAKGYRSGERLVLFDDEIEHVLFIQGRDVNSDGWDDLITVTKSPGGSKSKVHISLNQLKSGFLRSETLSFELGFVPDGISFDDVNEDGIGDIVLNDTDGSAFNLINDGNGFFRIE